ncbi:hypothetical protein SH528x_003817 [Novipirellula sp. SH528]|uniref:hypothetical protein n=1 Tax=Novipirellula sp. SH528 TaxID=3454466 RepID=UPI003F9FA616
MFASILVCGTPVSVVSERTDDAATPPAIMDVTEPEPVAVDPMTPLAKPEPIVTEPATPQTYPVAKPTVSSYPVLVELALASLRENKTAAPLAAGSGGDLRKGKCVYLNEAARVLSVVGQDVMQVMFV